MNEVEEKIRKEFEKEFGQDGLEGSNFILLDVDYQEMLDWIINKIKMVMKERIK